MIQEVLVVENSLGLHARAAAKLVRLASGFASHVHLSREGAGQSIDSKSILGVLMLSAAMGTRLQVSIHGADEAEAMEAIRSLFRARFGEDT